MLLPQHLCCLSGFFQTVPLWLLQFLDTPGVLNPRDKMQNFMLDYVHISIDEADCLMFIYDLTKYSNSKAFMAKQLELLQEIKKKYPAKNIILILNKTDLLKERKEVLPIIAALAQLDFFSDIIPISALKKSNVDEIILTISEYLPHSDFYYEPELLSTQSERFFVSEIIRENIFLSYSDEIPYSTEINLVDFKEREAGKWYISVEIIIEKQTQKGIIIGKKGEKLKKVMQKSRKSIEKHLQMPVYIEVFVKVRDKWRNNANLLHSYGY
jgi:GTP-binding protein Era